MAMLEIGPHVLDVTEFSRNPDIIRGGYRRALDNTFYSTIMDPKRSYGCTLIPMARPAWTALRATIANMASVVVKGELVEDPTVGFTAVVTITGERNVHDGNLDFLVQPTLLIEEE